jgi:hypothetical protein
MCQEPLGARLDTSVQLERTQQDASVGQVHLTIYFPPRGRVEHVLHVQRDQRELDI